MFLNALGQCTESKYQGWGRNSLLLKQRASLKLEEPQSRGEYGTLSELEERQPKYQCPEFIREWTEGVSSTQMPGPPGGTD